MNYTNMFRGMKKVDVDVQSILKVAKEEYCILRDDGDWKTALDAKDSKVLNKNYGTMNVAARSELKKLIHKLVQNVGNQNTGSRDKSKDICNNCG